MLVVSDEVMASLGFRKIRAGETISGKFGLVHVYEIRGLSLSESSTQPLDAVLDGEHFRYGFGSSVNSICEVLLSDVLVDDEAEWAKEKGCTPPYLVVKFGLDEEVACAGNYVRDENHGLTTFNGFGKARVSLSTRSRQVLPRLITGLVSSLAARPHQVRLLPIDQCFFGRNHDGRRIYDFRILSSAKGYGASHIEADELSELSRVGIAAAKDLKPRIVTFFNLAHVEEDPLKRFLFYFLAIEVKIHQVFATIEVKKVVDFPIKVPTRLGESSRRMLAATLKKSANLRDRFYWCTLFKWQDFGDADVDVFNHLKDVRDEIAHGSRSELPFDMVQAVEKFAAKLILL